MSATKYIICFFFICISEALAQPLDSERNSEISGEISDTKTILRNEDISANNLIECDVGYAYLQYLHPNSSGTYECIDDEQRYILIDYTDYATTFEDFVKFYPAFSIYTEGKALLTVSVGEADFPLDLAETGSFGELKFDTNKFDVETPTHYEYRVDYDGTSPGNHIIIKIGIGFMKLQNKLYLKPYVKGLVTIDKPAPLTLTVGLSITKLTFRPKNNSLMDKIDISY